MAHKITNANIKEWARDYQGELFDAILCDPPYELGFMGKSWDSSGIAFDQDMWADLLRILKPGGHLLAFSGSRTYHRMAVAIEDAGFEIRDMIEWVYGSGFPKSLNIGKAVDKLQGNERENLGAGNTSCEYLMRGEKCIGHGSAGKSQSGDTIHTETTKGTSEWEGWGTALKPAHEPCVLARKPIEGTVANNVLKHGTGGLNIDGTRVKTSESLAGGSGRIGGFAGKEQGADVSEYRVQGNETGRFPANLIHDGSDEVVGLFPQTKSGGGNKNSVNNQEDSFLGTGFGGTGTKTDWKIDSGSASRFFYCAKASKRERNIGLEGFEEVRVSDGRKTEHHTGHLRTSPKVNYHPTVKPLSLTKYLANLIKPPTGGRLLVPFSGSGSEMIGALQAGWEYVEGVELTEEYIPIAEARIKHWTNIKEEKSNQMELI